MLIVIGLFDAAIGAETYTPGSTPETTTVLTEQAEPFSTGWGIVLDNDILSPPASDRDYTGGIAFTVGGSRVANYPVSLDPALTWINKLLHFTGHD